MSCKKIVVIGCGGSGKSTFSIKLGKKLNIPVVHLDQLYWQENWQPSSEAEFDLKLSQEVMKDEWIIDGNYNRTMAMRLEKCDTIIYLDYSRFTSLLGAIKRVISNYGKTRSDMAANCPEKFDLEFLKWIWNYNKRNRKRYLEMIKNAKGINKYVLHNRKEADKLLAEI